MISVEPAAIAPVKTLPAESPATELLRVSPGCLEYEAGKVGAVPDHRVSVGPLSEMEYLTSIFSSRVYDVAVESPLDLATKLSQRLGVNMWVKRETVQPVSSTILLINLHLFFSLSRLLSSQQDSL